MTSRARAADRATVRASVAFVVASLAAIALTVVYAKGGQPQAEGALLATAFIAIGIGIVTWATHLLPHGPFEESRHRLAGSEVERDAVVADFEREGLITRRPVLVRLLTVAGVTLAAAAVVPLRSLGPRPSTSSLRTAWRGGRRAVNGDGTLVKSSDVPLDGLVTIFPEGDVGSADGQAVLLRVRPDQLEPQRGRESWTPEGLVAFSKVCTHAGCPVGLYQPNTNTLLCPCHQSAFDVLRAATPVTGPAAWPLPQLPLAIDDAGVVRSTGDFSSPVGPGWWKD